MIVVSCNREPPSYPPPEQRSPVDGPNPFPGTMILEMSDPGAPLHFVKDISPHVDGGSWRWTGQDPTLKILAESVSNLKLTTDFTIWEGSIKQVGPVTLTFYVNGHELDHIRYDTNGYKHFEKPIPSDWLMTDVESTLSMHIDKVYVAPEDGAKFGFILTRIGFTH